MPDFTVYHIVPQDLSYGPAKTPIANTALPKLRFPERINITWQLLKSDRVGDNGEFDDFYLDFADGTISAEACIDNNFNWDDDAKLAVALTSGTPVSTITIKNYTPGSTPVRPCGKLVFADDVEVYFNKIEASGDNYILTCSDDDYEDADFTPGANYLLDAALVIKEPPLVETDDSFINKTNKATGKFVVSVDSFNKVFEEVIEGSSSIANCKHELKIYRDGREAMIAQIPIYCLSSLNFQGPSAPNPSSISFARLNSKYAQLLTPDNTDAASASNEGQLRYQKTANSSQIDMCMLIGAGTYAWVEILRREW